LLLLFSMLFSVFDRVYQNLVCRVGLFIGEIPIFTTKQISVALPSTVISCEILTNFNVEAWFDVKFYAELQKYTLWGLKSNRKPLSWIFYKSCDLSIDQKFYAEIKKIYFMVSEMQIQIPKSFKKNLIFSVKKKFFQ
jgi:hypothetical protein